ncbi:MAG: hypothetical protein UX89_C0007G0031 [Parcubacteria group bacterium GW2011_GWA2_47_16]|nr:MAG: hypothetical protein UX89_C0007G0031 [Parcubacteria group bacterium GW2011_GWA2_47_16]
MPRNIVQDVIPRGHRVRQRDVSPPQESKIFREITSRRAEKEVVEEVVEDSYRVESGGENTGWGVHSSKNVPRIVLWSIAAVSTIVLLVILGNVFSLATLVITPQSQKAMVNLDLVAKSKVTSGEIGYTSLNLVRDKEEIIPAESEKLVETRSSGRIIIYNNYSTSAQRLVKNTRFETPNGLIYKIADSVTVPGRHSAEGDSVPGSVEALVYGETAGDEYNIGLTDFTLPGFKSNPERFSSFYARSKTPMTGGKIGKEKTVSDEKMLQARLKLERLLTDELLEEAKKQTPDASVFYDTAYRVEFQPILSGAVVKGDNVALRERAHLTAFFISEDALVEAVVNNALDDPDADGVHIPDIASLKFEFKNKSKYSSTSVGPIEFNLKGEMLLVWNIDEVKLKGDLINKKKSELSDIITKYPAIVKADVTLRPFWKRSFPSVPKKIKVVSNTESN